MSYNLLGLSGSFRSASFNTALLRAFAELSPDNVSLQVHDYRDIPLYDGDISEQPAGVARLNEAIASSDGLVVAVPEHNHSVPGVLKNAIDWCSRPAFKSVFAAKKVAIVSASPGLLGGVRAQQHLKNIFLGMGSEVFPHAEFVLGGAGRKFEDGRLTDEKTRDFLTAFAADLTTWIS